MDLYLEGASMPNPYSFQSPPGSLVAPSPHQLPPLHPLANLAMPVEHLSLSQLLQNQHILDLHKKVMRFMTMQLEHHEEMQKLRQEVAALKEENMQLHHFWWANVT